MILLHRPGKLDENDSEMKKKNEKASCRRLYNTTRDFFHRQLSSCLHRLPNHHTQNCAELTYTYGSNSMSTIPHRLEIFKAWPFDCIRA